MNKVRLAIGDSAVLAVHLELPRAKRWLHTAADGGLRWGLAVRRGVLHYRRCGNNSSARTLTGEKTIFFMWIFRFRKNFVLTTLTSDSVVNT